MKRALIALLLIAQTFALPQILIVIGSVVTPILAGLLNIEELVLKGAVKTMNAILNSTTGVCALSGSINMAQNGIRNAYTAAIGVFFFMVVIYMIEKTLFGRSRISVWVKAEDVMVTFFIVMVFHALFNLVGGTNYYLWEQAKEYVDRGLMVLIDNYFRLIFVNAIFATLFNLDIPVYAKEGTIGLSINTGLLAKPLTDSIMLVANMLQTSMLEWITRKLTLCITPLLVLAYFLPLGALLRALYFTRGAGSALLALGFSLFFFYPFLNFISYEIFKVSSNLFNANNISPTADYLIEITRYIILTIGVVYGLLSILGLLGKLVSTATGFVGGALKPVSSFLLSLPSKPLSLIYYVGAIGLVIGMVLGYVPALLRDLFIFVVIFGIALPAINIYLTLVLAIELSKMFGMQVDLTAIMRLI